MTSQAARFKVRGPFTYKVARDLERQALRTEDPIYGWTPTKRSEEHRRYSWIKRRTAELQSAGMEYLAASDQAYLDASEWWPDPTAHEYSAVPV
ncbi:hypothetical protein A5677_17070 [Mycobacterium malmoense]|uniref:Uncharacterized protein n=2 Tax=Mycobacterium malmoense TaxID=1780 RepID=A0A1B9DA89_MYCMA|nr:hypothetical protein A5677_17070 [Mycobacterium malmoense]